MRRRSSRTTPPPVPQSTAPSVPRCWWPPSTPWWVRQWGVVNVLTFPPPCRVLHITSLVHHPRRPPPLLPSPSPLVPFPSPPLRNQHYVPAFLRRARDAAVHHGADGAAAAIPKTALQPVDGRRGDGGGRRPCSGGHPETCWWGAVACRGRRGETGRRGEGWPWRRRRRPRPLAARRRGGDGGGGSSCNGQGGVGGRRRGGDAAAATVAIPVAARRSEEQGGRRGGGSGGSTGGRARGTCGGGNDCRCGLQVGGCRRRATQQSMGGQRTGWAAAARP